MKNFEYVMVTQWDLHWDNLSAKWKNSTLFTLSKINDNIAASKFKSESPTLFIKKSKDYLFEKSWIGISKNFRPDPNNGKAAIRFDVSNLEEIDCPEEYKKLSPGWYLNRNYSNQDSNNDTTYSNTNHPGFFSVMERSKGIEFEFLCYKLLRLIGIHELHKFPQDNNRGKADGFFKFSSLSVIYDTTLETDYINKKETQIENYVAQFEKEKITIDNKSYRVKDTHKQIWIITRNAHSKQLGTVEDIKVKEIPVKKLIEIYDIRLEQEISSDELCDLLRNIK